MQVITLGGCNYDGRFTLEEKKPYKRYKKGKGVIASKRCSYFIPKTHLNGAV